MTKLEVLNAIEAKKAELAALENKLTEIEAQEADKATRQADYDAQVEARSGGIKDQQRKAIIDAFAQQGIEACYGKGGFFLRGQGHVSFAKARKMTSVAVPTELERNTYEKPKCVNLLAFIAQSGW